MTPYQEGYAIGERVRIARIPRFATRVERAQWRSGFADAQAAAKARKLAQARTFRTYGLMTGGM